MFSDNKKMVALSLVAIFLITLDRWFKAVALNILDQDYIPLTSWFKLSLSFNKNIAFSLPLSGQILNILIILIILVLVYLFLRYRQQGQYLKAGWLFLIIVGALSNLLDRCKYQAVIDYLDLQYFTVFNLADVLICLGALGLIYLEFKKVPKDQKKKEEKN